MANKLKLTRNQLASFLKSHEEIKQFERLILLVEEKLNSGTVDDMESFIGSALAAANTNAAAIQAIADTMDMHPTPQRDNSVATDYIDLNRAGPRDSRIARVNWNPDDQTIEAGLDYGVVQQIGLETYFRVQNATGVTIPNGAVVGFSGVGGAAEVQVTPFIANGTQNSLYVVGIMTHDLPNSGQTGYCTVLGKVRGMNTSAWAVGDLLYCSTTTAGGLTNVKPIAPNNVIPIAVVLVPHATNGVISVRTIAEQPKHYGEFTNTTSIVPAAANTAYALGWPNTEIANGITVASTSRITLSQSGLYQFTTRMQFSASNANVKSAWLWYRLNGTTNYTSSSVISTLAQNGGYRALTATEFFTLAAGDYIEVMWAVDDVGLLPSNVAATAFAPSSPVGKVSITQVQQ